MAAAAGAAVIGAKPWRSLRNPVVLAAVGPVLLAAAQSGPKSMWLDLLMLAYDNLSKSDKRGLSPCPPCCQRCPGKPRVHLGRFRPP